MIQLLVGLWACSGARPTATPPSSSVGAERAPSAPRTVEWVSQTVPGETFHAWVLSADEVLTGNARGWFLWDVDTGAQLRHPALPVTRLATRGSDGSRDVGFLVSRQTLSAWALPEATQLWQTPLPMPNQHRLDFDALGTSPDGRWIAWISPESAQVFDATTGDRVTHLGTGGLHPIGSPVFTPDGRLVITPVRASEGANEALVAAAFDVVSGAVVRRFQVPEAAPRRRGGRVLTLSPDGRTLLATDPYGDPLVFDVGTGRLRFELTGLPTPRRGAKQVAGGAISPNGRWAVTGGGVSPGMLGLWNLRGGDLAHQLQFAPNPRLQVGRAMAREPSFSADGRLVTASLEEAATAVWDVATGKRLMQHDHGRKGIVSRFSGDDGLLVVGDELSMVQRHTGTVRSRFTAAWPRVAAELTFVDDDRALWIRHVDNLGQHPGLSRLNAATGGLDRYRVAGGHVSPRGDRVLLETKEGDSRRVVLWDPASDEAVCTFEPRLDWRAVTFSPSGRWLAVPRFREEVVRIVDVDSCDMVHSLPITGRTQTQMVRFTPDERHVVVVEWDIRRFELGAETAPQSIRAESGAWVGVTDSTIVVHDGGRIRRISFDGDERWMVQTGQGAAPVISADGTRLVWFGLEDQQGHVVDLETGEELRLLEGTVGETYPNPRRFPVAMSPDGRRVAHGNVDGALSVWDVASGQRLARDETAQEHAIRSVVYNRAGTRIATGSAAGMVRLWSTADHAATADLAVDERGRWAVAHRDGRVTSSPLPLRHIGWTVGNDPILPWQVRDARASPGLLGWALGVTDQAPPPLPGIGSIEVPPRLRVEGPTPEGTLMLQATDRGSGVGQVWVAVGGRPVEALGGCTTLEPGAPCVLSLGDLGWTAEDTLEVSVATASGAVWSWPHWREGESP